MTSEEERILRAMYQWIFSASDGNRVVDEACIDELHQHLQRSAVQIQLPKPEDPLVTERLVSMAMLVFTKLMTKTKVQTAIRDWVKEEL